MPETTSAATMMLANCRVVIWRTTQSRNQPAEKDSKAKPWNLNRDSGKNTTKVVNTMTIGIQIIRASG